jgi:hypothetical protein
MPHDCPSRRTRQAFRNQIRRCGLRFRRNPSDAVLGFYEVIGEVRERGGWDRIGQRASDRVKQPWWRRLWR